MAWEWLGLARLIGETMSWLEAYRKGRRLGSLTGDIYTYMSLKDPYPIGMKGFSEDDLSDRFSRNRMEIADALLQLESKGLIERGGKIYLLQSLWFRKWSDRKSP